MENINTYVYKYFSSYLAVKYIIFFIFILQTTNCKYLKNNNNTQIFSILCCVCKLDKIMFIMKFNLTLKKTSSSHSFFEYLCTKKKLLIKKIFRLCSSQQYVNHNMKTGIIIN